MRILRLVDVLLMIRYHRLRDSSPRDSNFLSVSHTESKWFTSKLSPQTSPQALDPIDHLRGPKPGYHFGFHICFFFQYLTSYRAFGEVFWAKIIDFRRTRHLSKTLMVQNLEGPKPQEILNTRLFHALRLVKIHSLNHSTMIH